MDRFSCYISKNHLSYDLFWGHIIFHNKVLGYEIELSKFQYIHYHSLQSIETPQTKSTDFK